ncbi:MULTISPECIES: YceI family protein [Mesonia]|uniref:Protein YceI n=1 Tax=Mesonia oceanica TaxID=2687242 RepID=A0AC61Y9I4_9FLAO|nr:MULTISPECIES: YceI family protein [Mesonia]MAN27906.1 lipid-binding protein [Mesonia sp.]MAQ41085.1 lipid-binding protein [Mesonia sp.]VVV01181.1 Protein YceI [Mesonia oceanica]|tara:strand:+ start:65315 stop:65890 length:576 start_codon:yes stop_codon:yes gene_type:complete
MNTKILKSAGLLAMVFTMISFTTNPIKKKTLNTKESKIEWEGEKLTGSHEGTIMFKEGYLTMDGDKITGGEFIVDMTSIAATDLEGEGKQKLEGHLKSDDFFGVANHPTAKLVIKNATKKGDAYGIIADLTIKGKTNPVTFDLEMNGDTATADLTIDRTKYDVKYGSGSIFDGLGDKVIYDEFKLDVKLKF